MVDCNCENCTCKEETISIKINNKRDNINLKIEIDIDSNIYELCETFKRIATALGYGDELINECITTG